MWNQAKIIPIEKDDHTSIQHRQHSTHQNTVKKATTLLTQHKQNYWNRLQPEATTNTYNHSIS